MQDKQKLNLAMGRSAWVHEINKSAGILAWVIKRDKQKRGKISVGSLREKKIRMGTHMGAFIKSWG